MPIIKVMSWNMAGAKLLRQLNLDDPQHSAASSYINAYREVWQNRMPFLTTPPPQYPDIILLQECIGFIDHSPDPLRAGDGNLMWPSGDQILQNIYGGYNCFFYPAFSSHKDPHPTKWQRYRNLPSFIEAEQGYGICISNAGNLRKLWISNGSTDVPAGPHEYDLCLEAIPLPTGLYLGNRDTEPRLVIMGRMHITGNHGDARYVNFLNVHLTTLKDERVGKIRLNRKASERRLQQLDLILDNVISAYQEATADRISRNADEGKDDVWILGGDFNAKPDSKEITLVKRMGFVDGNPDKHLIDANPNRPHNGRIGTKWSLNKILLPPTVLDYIFCGLERTTFPEGSQLTPIPEHPYRPQFQDSQFETDHAVLFASFNV